MSNAPTSCPGAGPGTRWATRAWSTTCSTTACGAPGRGTTWATSAEAIAARHGVTREAQDAWSLRSHQRARPPSSGETSGRRSSPSRSPGDAGATVVDTDECPRPDTSAGALAALRPVFAKDGTVTAGNASGIADGAAALVLTSGRRAAEWGLRPLARYVASANAALDPLWLFQAPVPTIERLLQRTETTLDDYDLIELNEAFAAQMVADGKQLGWDEERVNVNGGAIALGHPLGCSGARLLTTLLYALRARDGRRGIGAPASAGARPSPSPSRPSPETDGRTRNRRRYPRSSSAPPWPARAGWAAASPRCWLPPGSTSPWWTSTPPACSWPATPSTPPSPASPASSLWTPRAVQAIRARIRFTTVLDASAGPDLLVEAVVEDLATKQRVLERGAEVLPDTAPLVSNTSSISITALAGAVGGPERVAGMHFFNPVPVMPLVEVVRGQPPPSPPSVRWSPSPSAWARPPGGRRLPRLRRQPHPAPDAQRGLLRPAGGRGPQGDHRPGDEARAAPPHGPLELADYIGLDVCLNILEVLHRDLGDSKYRPCPLLRRMVAPGSWGARAGPAFMSTTPPAEHPFALTPAQVAFRDEVRALVLSSVAPGAGARTSARCSPRTPSPPWPWPGSWACRSPPPGVGGAWGPPS